MEDQHMDDITLNPLELSQEEYIQESPMPLILWRKKRMIPKWSELPPNVLEEIYLYLDRKDRSQMSLVCRKWCQVYSAPSLWRNMNVCFPQKSRGRRICQALRFAQKYGCWFRHVEINYYITDYWRISLMQKQLVQFLEILTSFSELSSISFINRMKCSVYRYGRNGFENVFPNLIYFLLSQKNLESIVFKRSRFSNIQALEVLRTIFLKSNGTLKHLVLKEFSKVTVFGDSGREITHTPSTYDILMNLQEFEIDYSDILENLIAFCFEYGSYSELPNKVGTLKEMKIRCFDYEWNGYRGISPDAWKYFAKKCPSLRINFFYEEDSEDGNGFETFIVRHMPIKLLDLRYTKYCEAADGRLLPHLLSREINKLLEEMHIRWVPNFPDFASDLINFLQTCPKLLVLELRIKHPVEELDVFLNNIQYNKPPALERLNINITNIRTNEEASSYLNLSVYFTPLLLAVNLRLTLRRVMKKYRFLQDEMEI